MRFTSFVVALLLPLGSLADTASVAPFWVDRLGAFKRAVREAGSTISTAEMSAFVEAQYRVSGFPSDPDDIKNQIADATEAHAVFEALDLRTFYTRSARNALLLERFALALQARHGLGSRELGDVYGALVLGRQFGRAEIWHAKLDPAAQELIPRFVDPPGVVAPSVWRVSNRDDELLHLPLGHLKGPRVLAVVSLGCHFSRNAMAALLEDKALIDRLSPITTWMIPPERMLHYPELQDWNSKHSQIQLVLAHSLDEWPMVDDWSTPTFYFLLDGKPVRRVTGWPKEGNTAAIARALDEITSPATERAKAKPD